LKKLGLLAALAIASPASAGEIFAGIHSHDVKTGLTVTGIEKGVDFQLGFRGGRIRALGAIGAPSPYIFASVAGDEGADFVAAGIGWKIGGQIYVRPGVGIAIHTGPSSLLPGEQRIDFGSRILFEPEIGIGVQASKRLSIEASWVHLSHGTLFGANNPGMDNIGVRLNYGF
jgi:hypothetical protein